MYIELRNLNDKISIRSHEAMKFFFYHLGVSPLTERCFAISTAKESLYLTFQSNELLCHNGASYFGFDAPFRQDRLMYANKVLYLGR